MGVHIQEVGSVGIWYAEGVFAKPNEAEEEHLRFKRGLPLIRNAEPYLIKHSLVVGSDDPLDKNVRLNVENGRLSANVSIVGKPRWVLMSGLVIPILNNQAVPGGYLLIGDSASVEFRFREGGGIKVAHYSEKIRQRPSSRAYYDCWRGGY